PTRPVRYRPFQAMETWKSSQYRMAAFTITGVIAIQKRGLQAHGLGGDLRASPASPKAKTGMKTLKSLSRASAEDWLTTGATTPSHPCRGTDQQCSRRVSISKR